MLWSQFDLRSFTASASAVVLLFFSLPISTLASMGKGYIGGPVWSCQDPSSFANLLKNTIFSDYFQLLQNLVLLLLLVTFLVLCGRFVLKDRKQYGLFVPMSAPFLLLLVVVAVLLLIGSHYLIFVSAIEYGDLVFYSLASLLGVGVPLTIVIYSLGLRRRGDTRWSLPFVILCSSLFFISMPTLAEGVIGILSLDQYPSKVFCSEWVYDGVRPEMVMPTLPKTQ